MVNMTEEEINRLHTAIRENEGKTHELIKSVPSLGPDFRDQPEYINKVISITGFENMMASKFAELERAHTNKSEMSESINRDSGITEKELAKAITVSNMVLDKETKEYNKVVDYTSTSELIKRNGIMHRDRALAYLFIVCGVIAVSTMAGRGGKALILAYVILGICFLAMIYFGIRAFLGWITS